MGLFNEVEVECPNCGEIHIHKSKAGSCCLSTNSLDTAEEEDAKDFLEDVQTGDVYCRECHHQFTAQKKVRVISGYYIG